MLILGEVGQMICKSVHHWRKTLGTELTLSDNVKVFNAMFSSGSGGRRREGVR